MAQPLPPSGVDIARPALRFEAHGTTAPDPLPPGEVWLDVGGRLTGRVFDHHGGDTGTAASTAAVVWGALPILTAGGSVDTLVLHRHPDLDAITAAWLVLRREALLAGHVRTEFAVALVAAVTRHDQGFIISRDLGADLGVVMRETILDREWLDDAARVHEGMRFLDRLAEAFPLTGDLEGVVAALSPSGLASRLDAARRLYEADLEAAEPLRLMLPGRTEQRQNACLRHFVDPHCPLLKDFARRQDPTAPEFFAAMAVSTPAGIAPEGTPLWRHVISTDPATGLALPGLGAALEMAEQHLEDERSLPVLGGRERVAEGQGRFGGTIPSPWYDGRGHAWTIVDSPAVTLPDGKRVIASRLDPAALACVIGTVFG